MRAFLIALLLVLPLTAQKRVPPKRSSQIEDGFGINSDLPRDPYLPWDQRWWTRMFDAGVSWIRIGQYENTSDYTSWDWIEQKRGVLAIPPGLDDYVDSLVDNGVKVQVQLLYGNPMYTSPAGKLPDAIVPEPGGFHNPDRSLYSVFWPPTTPAQIAAFVKYVQFVVGHFRGRIGYYALWNEQDIDYWNPLANPEDYGHLLKAFIPAVHGADPQAKVIYGGQADPTREFARRALDACDCAAGIDVFAYHTYPGYGRNVNPEAMDSGAYGEESPAKLRELVRGYPGIRKDIPFWDDEFNSIPAWVGSDESVQAKYIPRGLVYNWARGVRTFVWLLMAATDGNEYDDFGMIHGLRHLPDDFTPRPVFYALQNTNALFADTHLDPSIKIAPVDVWLHDQAQPFLAYGFRGKTGKPIVAYWLAAHSEPGGAFPPVHANLTILNSGITHPVLIDVVSGDIQPLAKPEANGVFANLPVRDSVMAIADESYFDWQVLPEAPSSLIARVVGNGVQLVWQTHDGAASNIVKRRAGDMGSWSRIAKSVGDKAAYVDDSAPAGVVCYRVRSANLNGESPYSNIVRVRR
ncbi:MAG TPA: hypothetical protein VMR62_26755 [Bryobacteraceae bacterium]|jgi:hypothetical protein|nr:hypothetical protein [Bryobacteraceae bacterium]